MKATFDDVGDGFRDITFEIAEGDHKNYSQLAPPMPNTHMTISTGEATLVLDLAPWHLATLRELINRRLDGINPSPSHPYDDNQSKLRQYIDSSIS